MLSIVSCSNSTAPLSCGWAFSSPLMPATPCRISIFKGIKDKTVTHIRYRFALVHNPPPQLYGYVMQLLIPAQHSWSDPVSVQKQVSASMMSSIAPFVLTPHHSMCRVRCLTTPFVEDVAILCRQIKLYTCTCMWAQTTSCW